MTIKNTAPADAARASPSTSPEAVDFGTEPGKIKTLIAVYAPQNAIFLGASQDGKAVGVQTATDDGHPVAQLRTVLAPGESATFRVAFLGQAKNAKARHRGAVHPGCGADEGPAAALRLRRSDPAGLIANDRPEYV